jgi:hypothetical protein
MHETALFYYLSSMLKAHRVKRGGLLDYNNSSITLS